MMYQNNVRCYMVMHGDDADAGDVCIYSIRLHNNQTHEVDIKHDILTSGIKHLITIMIYSNI